MKRLTFLTILLALVAMTGWGQKVWNNPGYRNVPKGFQFDVNEVEFRPDETVLHITVRNRPNARFSFGKSTVLKTEDDKSYPIISAQKTRDGETDSKFAACKKKSSENSCLYRFDSLPLL